MLAASLGAGKFDAAACGSSAGRRAPPMVLLAGLPSDSPAAVTTIQSLRPLRHINMVRIVATGIRLRVRESEEGGELQTDATHISPPSRHLLINPGGGLARANWELLYFSRPSADLLFE